MALSSREKFLEQGLSILQWKRALDAFDLVKKEMCAEKGYKRYNGTHYYYHLIDVAQKLIGYGIRDEKIITAALLHDILEDVPAYNFEIINFMYGTNVAQMVDLVTKKEAVDYSKQENMTSYLNAISENIGASLIKTADRIHNFGTLSDATAEHKIKQVTETESFFIPFFKLCRNKYPRYAFIFFDAKTQIEPHLQEIKDHYDELNKLKNEFIGDSLISNNLSLLKSKNINFPPTLSNLLDWIQSRGFQYNLDFAIGSNGKALYYINLISDQRETYKTSSNIKEEAAAQAILWIIENENLQNV